MKKIKGVQKIVHEILIDKPETRGDDFLLVLEVLKTKVPADFSISDTFKNHNELGLPSFASIIRTRRKLQAQHEELKASNTVQQFREAKRGRYIQYALYVEG